MIIEAHAVNLANEIKVNVDSRGLVLIKRGLISVINSLGHDGTIPLGEILPWITQEDIYALVGNAHQATYKEIGNWGIQELKTSPVLQKIFAKGSIILPTNFLSLPFRPSQYYLVINDEGNRNNMDVHVGKLSIKIEKGIPVYSLDEKSLAEDVTTFDRTKVLGLVFSNKAIFDRLMPKIIEGYIKRGKVQNDLKQILSTFLGRVIANLA